MLKLHQGTLVSGCSGVRRAPFDTRAKSMGRLWMERECVVAHQLCTNAMVNETTIMQAKAKFRFMSFPSESGVMALILNRSDANKKFALVI
jgi:hypothetical protein